jgi:2-oxo-4-hydroxy-4-carboxy-5-ureidoimidazoline decarboxylase
MPMTIAELNAMDHNAFVDTVGWVFEHSPWVAASAWERRPFASLDAIHVRMMEAVENAPVDQQEALLRAHPDLGARVAMSRASRHEQSDAGLSALTADELARLHALNTAYRAKFGFPFIYAVKGATKQDILEALERRLVGTREGERREALRQVYRLARFRLEEVVA